VNAPASIPTFENLIPRAEAIMRHTFANAPIAVRYALEAVNGGMQTSQAQDLLLEAALFGVRAATEDKAEGTTAFLAKRAPDFQGR
jgi:enoyl-CoA hydratase/carnithine racemase